MDYQKNKLTPIKIMTTTLDMDKLENGLLSKDDLIDVIKITQTNIHELDHRITNTIQDFDTQLEELDYRTKLIFGMQWMSCAIFLILFVLQ